MITKETSQKIRNMSIVCALLVVTIHVSWPHDTFSFTWMMGEVVRDGIARIAVPFFFVVSGFFLSKHMDDHGWYGSEVRKRIYSLLIPYFVWTIITTIFVTPLSIGADVAAHRPLWSSTAFAEGRWLMAIGLDPRQGPWCAPALWYVRCLFVFVLLAPAFKWLVVKGKFVWLAIAFALTLVHASWHPFPSYLQKCFAMGFSLSGVFYFSAGIFLGLYDASAVRTRPAALCAILGGGAPRGKNTVRVLWC